MSLSNMSLSLSNYTSLPQIALINPPHLIHDAYCGIPSTSLNTTRTLSLPSFPVYECGSCVSICHSYTDDTMRNFTKCIDVLVAEAHPFQTKYFEIPLDGGVADGQIDSGIEVGEELWDELGSGASVEPLFKGVKMATVALERCAGVWDGGVMEGKFPQGQFAILAEMVPQGGDDVVEEGVEKVASSRVKRRGMVKTGVEGRLFNFRQKDTDSTEEIEKVQAALNCVGELLRGGVSPTEAEELCALGSVLDSAA